MGLLFALYDLSFRFVHLNTFSGSFIFLVTVLVDLYGDMTLLTRKTRTPTTTTISSTIPTNEAKHLQLTCDKNECISKRIECQKRYTYSLCNCNVNGICMNSSFLPCFAWFCFVSIGEIDFSGFDMRFHIFEFLIKMPFHRYRIFFVQKKEMHYSVAEIQPDIKLFRFICYTVCDCVCE